MPKLSLGLRLDVTRGYNQVQRVIGQFSALYMRDETRILDYFVELAPGATFSSKPDEVTSTLIISTTAQLTCTGNFVVSGEFRFVINKMLVLDDDIGQYTVTNTGSNTAKVYVNEVSRTSLSPAAPIYVGTSLKPANVTAAFVESLPATGGPKNQTFHVVAAASEYIYYCYPMIMGSSTFEVSGFIGGFHLARVVPMITASGSVDYYVYESDNSGLGDTTITVGA